MYRHKITIVWGKKPKWHCRVLFRIKTACPIVKCCKRLSVKTDKGETSDCSKLTGVSLKMHWMVFFLMNRITSFLDQLKFLCTIAFEIYDFYKKTENYSYIDGYFNFMQNWKRKWHSSCMQCKLNLINIFLFFKLLLFWIKWQHMRLCESFVLYYCLLWVAFIPHVCIFSFSFWLYIYITIKKIKGTPLYN